MKGFCKAFFYTVVLLLVSHGASDRVTLQKNGSQAAYSTLLDWMEEPAGEEDSLEGEDDEATSDANFPRAINHAKTSIVPSGHFNFNEFIREIIPPPPQA